MNAPHGRCNKCLATLDNVGLLVIVTLRIRGPLESVDNGEGGGCNDGDG